MGLLRTRQQGHTVESIHQAMIELRERFPLAGAREMSSLLFHERDMSVSYGPRLAQKILCAPVTTWECQTQDRKC